MRYVTKIVLLLLVITLVPSLAKASEERDLCLCTAALARVLCKDPSEISYVARVRPNIYLFSIFYANKVNRFFCGVGENFIRIQGKDVLKLTRSIPYSKDASGKCSIIGYTNPECPIEEPVGCCQKVTVKQKKSDEFWNKTLPDLLGEDLKKAFGNGNDTGNATGNGTNATNSTN